MYYPYFRGRQYELIALRELAEKHLIGDKVCPVIEPIKPTSTLITALQAFDDQGLKCILVANPGVGEFLQDVENLDERSPFKIDFNKLLESKQIIKGFIVNDIYVKELKKHIKEELSKCATINFSRDEINAYKEVFEGVTPIISLIPEDRQFSRTVKGNKATLVDRFNKAQKNADYKDKKREDEFFSDDHLYFEEENFQGFADYSVIGSDFSDTGFAPLAVAIHIVYFANDYELRVHHFVSDSNDDYNDPAGKFGEAVEKLVLWTEEKEVTDTYGLKELKKCFRDGRYPGLGTIKKYSLMHHLELMSRYLEGEL